MIKIITGIILLLLTSGSFAVDRPSLNSVDVSLRSYHFSGDCYAACTQQFNEENYGIGLTVEATSILDVSFGILKNSFNRDTTYIAGNLKRAYYFENFIVKPGFALGIADGYDDTPSGFKTDSGIVPIISPNVSIYIKRLHFNVGMLPSANTVVGILRAGVRF